MRGLAWGLVLLGGCWFPVPNECEPRAMPSATVTDARLGEHVGTLEWLQRGTSTDVTIRVSAPAETGPFERCEGVSVPVRWEVQSGDGLLVLDVERDEGVHSGALVASATFLFDLDTDALLEAGLAPYLPDAAEHHPSATLYLTVEDHELTEGTLFLTTDGDHVTLGVIDLP